MTAWDALPSASNKRDPASSLGRLEDASPVVAKLLDLGWDDEDFLALCREHGLIDAELGE